MDEATMPEEVKRHLVELDLRQGRASRRPPRRPLHQTFDEAEGVDFVNASFEDSGFG